MPETYEPDLRLRRLRETAGLNMTGLANLADCSAHHLRMVEVGGRQPSIVLAHRIARALTERLGRAVDISEFFTPLQQRKVPA